MRTSSIDDPEFWRARAIDARAVATRMCDELSRTTMLRLAARYERIANRIVRGMDIFGTAGSTERAIERRQPLEP
jgi:hypothetical protein